MISKKNFKLKLINGKYMLKKPAVKSIEETLNKVINEKCSMARFGDGEVFIAVKSGGVGFQHYNDELSNRLRKILSCKENNLLICIHDAYSKINHDRTDSEKEYWKKHLQKYSLKLNALLDKSKVYYNATCTRIYSVFNDKSKSKELFNLFKKIWENRDVVIIEGEKSRIGVNNDLLDNANSVERILVPAEEAYNKYDKIYREAIKIDKKKLILIAAGPTATVLAYDLSKLGYQAIDIGHIDIEYEWFKLGTNDRVPIKGKYVNEANYRNPEDINNSKYANEIISIIK